MSREIKESKFWDDFADRYDSFIATTANTTYKSILEHISKEIPNGSFVLDVGTGTGIIPFGICHKAQKIIATDISAEMIKIARQKQKALNVENIDFQIQDSYKLTFPDNSFDVVIATNLLHLVQNPEEPIKEVKRVMKSNGIFIAPTFCMGENWKSFLVSTIGGFVSGFKVKNKWSIHDFLAMMTLSDFNLAKIIEIPGRYPAVYAVMIK